MNSRQLFSLAALLVAGQVQAAPFSSASYNADVTFRDQLGGTSMTLAFDGTNYWSSSGGNQVGARYARYDAAGNALGTFSPGLDFRSVFTNLSGDVFARQFANSTIYKQTAPGVFVSHVTLSGGTLDLQSSVVLNASGEYIAMNAGTVSRWNAAGSFLGSFNLSGYASAGYPYNRGIAAAGNYLFTYNSNDVLSAWDYSGNLIDTAVLNGAGSSFDSGFSLSYANNRIFIVDAAGQTWRGYDIGVSNDGNPVPEPASLALLGIALLGAAAARRKAA